MSLFDLILIQPIFNVLVFIYGIIPGHDFGIALILFTVLIRVLLWPLVRKQLHQTKLMRSLQPELQRIRKRTAGNKQLEAQMMMELYREKGVNPFGSIGILILQLPIFIALYAVVRLITTNNQNIPKYTYSILDNIPFVKHLIDNSHSFNESLLGMVSLSRHAVDTTGVYWPLLVLAVIAAGLQFFQSKQLLPKATEGRKLRDLLKEQAAGKRIDQSEVSALMSSRMVYLFAGLTFIVSVYLIPGALVLYLATTSAVAIVQQARVLGQDTAEMEVISGDVSAQKAKNTKEAQLVPTPKKSAKKRRKK